MTWCEACAVVVVAWRWIIRSIWSSVYPWITADIRIRAHVEINTLSRGQKNWLVQERPLYDENLLCGLKSSTRQSRWIIILSIYPELLPTSKSSDSNVPELSWTSWLVPMTSRYFIRTLRRLLLYSSSSKPHWFRTRTHLWTSIGTATLIGSAIYHYSPLQSFSRSFTLQARSLDKDLSHSGRWSLLGWNEDHCRISFCLEKQFFLAAHDGQVDVLRRSVFGRLVHRRCCCHAFHSNRLVEEEKFDVNLRHPLGWTPLLVAVINNRMDCVKYLLSKGADPNQPDEFSNVHAMAKKLHCTAVQGNRRSLRMFDWPMWFES